MAINLSLLTTREECDEVLDELAAKLDSYQHRTELSDFADRKAGRNAASVASRLADVNADIAYHTATLARTDLSVTRRKQVQRDLRRANSRKADLTDRSQARTGSAPFLADVEDEFVAAVIATYTAIQTDVLAHKATLPA